MSLLNKILKKTLSIPPNLKKGILIYIKKDIVYLLRKYLIHQCFKIFLNLYFFNIFKKNII